MKITEEPMKNLSDYQKKDAEFRFSEGLDERQHD